MKNQSMRLLSFFLLCILISFSCTAYSNNNQEQTVRNPDWAIPVTLEGVNNLHKINSNLYRSAQPTSKGMRKLEQLGIKTIVNLRYFHDDIDEINGTNLEYKEHGINAWNIDDKDIF